MTNNYSNQSAPCKPKIEIHEDQYGGIYINGCSNKNVYSVKEVILFMIQTCFYCLLIICFWKISKTLEILKNGAKIRSTGATNMNSQSSRSHAIFTLNIKQKYMANESQSGVNENEMQTLTAKFHFVDLAGSERLKRTGATGSRAKEGICINRGLVSVLNVWLDKWVQNFNCSI